MSTLLSMRKLVAIALYATAFAAGPAMAEPLNIRATMVPKEQIKLEFKDGSGHFVLMVRREGQGHTEPSSFLRAGLLTCWWRMSGLAA